MERVRPWKAGESKQAPRIVWESGDIMGPCRSWLGAKKPSQNSTVVVKTKVLAPHCPDARAAEQSFERVKLLPGLWPCCFLLGLEFGCGISKFL